MTIKKHTIKLILLLAIVMIGITTAPNQKAYAATAVKVCAVSYIDESVLVFTNGNSKIYYATETDASRNTWDVVNVNSGEKIAVIDISWMSTNTENILIIKGDGNSAQSRIIIKKIPQKLEVSIDYSGIEAVSDIGELFNIMSSEGTGMNPITFLDLEWKKSENGRWMDTRLLTKELLESYQIKGTYLYFRLKPVDAVVTEVVASNGDISKLANTYAYTKDDMGIVTDEDTKYPDGTEGRRASNEVKIKLAKKTVLPVNGVDGEDFTVAVKYGQEYRVTIDGNTSGWTQVIDRSTKDIPLTTIVGDADMDGLTTAFKPMVIEIRQFATSKTAASKINSISLSKQKELEGDIIIGAAPPDADSSDKNIYITYNGSKELNVVIPSASVDTPYEYCVFKKGDDFDPVRAAWTAITKNTSTKVSATKATDFSTIYIRMKEIKYKAATSTKAAVPFELASTYKTVVISYPAVPVIVKETHSYIKGYSEDIVIPVVLNVDGKLPFETIPLSVKLGTKDILFEYASDVTGSMDPHHIYTMTITIRTDTLDALANCTARALYIYFGNGTVDKTSVKLTIKNPTAATSLSATIKQGTDPGTTAFDMVSKKPVTSKWVYFVSDAVVKNVYKEDIIDSVAISAGETPADVKEVSGDSANNIVITAGKYLTVFELDSTNHVLKYKSAQVNADKIKTAP